MASLYKKRDIWYISSMIDSKRLSVSLKTKNKRKAKRLKPKAELEFLSQLKGQYNQATIFLLMI